MYLFREARGDRYGFDICVEAAPNFFNAHSPDLEQNKSRSTGILPHLTKFNVHL